MFFFSFYNLSLDGAGGGADIMATWKEIKPLKRNFSQKLKRGIMSSLYVNLLELLLSTLGYK